MAKFRLDDGTPSGRIVMRSTKQRNPRDAQRIADDWERAAKKARAGELTQAIVLKTMNDLLEVVDAGQAVCSQSTRDFFLERQQAVELKPATFARYKPILDGFLAFIGDRRSNARIGSITAAEIERFRNRQLFEGRSASTVNLSLKVLRAVFNHARRLGHTLTNPAEGVTMLSEASADQRLPFTPEQIRELIRAADDEWRGMILFGFYTGIRLHDAANLTWRNVDLASRTLSFRDAKTSARKNKNQRDTTVFLHSDLLAYLVALPVGDDPDAPLFPSLFGKPSGSHGGLSMAFGRIMARAGVRAPLGEQKSGKGRQFKMLGFHSLRHSLISTLSNSDVSADVRKQIAGHSSDEIHRRYVHLELETQRRAIERMPTLS